MSRREIVVKARRTKVLGFALDSQAWRTLKAKHKAYSKSQHLPCHLETYGMCLLPGQPIDYTTTGTQASYETDHKKPRDTHPEEAMVWANLAASHQRCNRSRKAKPLAEQHIWIRPKF